MTQESFVTRWPLWRTSSVRALFPTVSGSISSTVGIFNHIKIIPPGYSRNGEAETQSLASLSNIFCSIVKSLNSACVLLTGILPSEPDVNPGPVCVFRQEPAPSLSIALPHLTCIARTLRQWHIHWSLTSFHTYRYTYLCIFKYEMLRMSVCLSCVLWCNVTASLV